VVLISPQCSLNLISSTYSADSMRFPHSNTFFSHPFCHPAESQLYLSFDYLPELPSLRLLIHFTPFAFVDSLYTSVLHERFPAPRNPPVHPHDTKGLPATPIPHHHRNGPAQNLPPMSTSKALAMTKVGVLRSTCDG